MVASVPIEKGKQPGLRFRFKCVDQISLVDQGNVCFPIHGGMSTVVTVKLGGGAPIPCGTTPGLPGTCSYSFVDAFQHSNTCGPASNQPCVDTVLIKYNGLLPAFTPVQYSAAGVLGVSGELENLANLVSFGTLGNTPSTASLELVFDISGSMDSPAVPGGTIKRIRALQDASQVLFGVLGSFALPGSGTFPGDKLGAVFFSTSATPNASPSTSTPCSGMPVTNLVQTADPTQLQTISNAVQTQVPTAATSIGAGLQSADCGFTQETSPKNVNKQILLFSDGDQNTPPNVQVSGSNVQVSDNAGANFANYPSNSSSVCPMGSPTPCIRICPVTAGRLAAPGFTLQQNIANAACDGNNAHIRDADPMNPDPSLRDPQTFVQADLETFFAQTLTTFVTSDKLEMLSDTIGTVVRGSTAVEKFLAAANDVQTNLTLSWSCTNNEDRRLPFQLQAPDGTSIDLANRTTFGRNVSFTTIVFPLFQANRQVAQQGEWKLTIEGATLRSPSCKYHLLVMADNPTIVSDFTSHVGDVGTGEQIPVQVKLTDNGSPVLNANVQVQLMGPANSQGNVLSRTPAPASAPGSDPASTKGQAKLDALYGNPANASLFADNTLPTITLHDANNTGVYTGSFTGTSNEGHYYFTIRAVGKSATAGDIQRTFWIARFVRSKPDAKKTAFNLISSSPQSNGTVLVKLQAIPHDHLGNFLGPGYEKDMQINSSEGTVEAPLDDKLDGSYEITYRLPSSSSNPSFTIVIMGQTVTTQSLNHLRSSR